MPARDTASDQPGLAAFMFPEHFDWAGKGERALHILESLGFEVLLRVEIACGQASDLLPLFQLSDEGPETFDRRADKVAILFAFDVRPSPPPLSSQVENTRLVGAQHALRQISTANMVVRITSRSAQAWEALRTLCPKKLNSIQSKVTARIAEFATTESEGDLTAWGDKAKVELIDFGGIRAVRKTFRRTALEAMKREAAVLADLQGKLPGAPKLLERGDNYIIMERVPGTEMRKRRRNQPQPLPLKRVRQIADVLKRCVALGYDPVDLRPTRNILYHPSGLSVIDFEHWRKSHPASAEESCCLNGIPPEDPAYPVRALFDLSWSDAYPVRWLPYICLSKRSFLNDPPWLQRVKRPWFLLVAYAQWGGRLLERVREFVPKRR